MPDKYGKLTREEMENVIRNGGSVIVNGQHHSNIATLPTQADVALQSGDKEQMAATSEALDEQIAALQAQKAKLAEKPEKEEKEEKPTGAGAGASGGSKKKDDKTPTAEPPAETTPPDEEF